MEKAHIWKSFLQYKLRWSRSPTLMPQGRKWANHMLFHCLCFLLAVLLCVTLGAFSMSVYFSFSLRKEFCILQHLSKATFPPSCEEHRSSEKKDCPQHSGSQWEGKTIPPLSRFKTEDTLPCCLTRISTNQFYQLHFNTEESASK